MSKTVEPYGWVFKGKFFKDENDMRGMTMSEGNVPVAVYSSPVTSQWIPVTDRLPDEFERVMAIDDDGDIFIDYYNFDKIFDTGGEVIFTHWQPLPPAPIK